MGYLLNRNGLLDVCIALGKRASLVVASFRVGESLTED